MNIMLNVYATLKAKKYFIDNEYLHNYSVLIERNRRTPRRGGQTHQHHILPRSWFKLTQEPVNNDLNNLVNLSHRDHFLAHYFLCLCTEDPFKYANELALQCLLSSYNRRYDTKQLLTNLPLYNNIYEDYVKKLKCSYKLYKGE